MGLLVFMVLQSMLIIACSKEAKEAGQVWEEPSVGMRMRYIPAGAFLMGSPSEEPGRDYDETQHRVTLTRGYWMGETEVTQGEWKSVMVSNPSRFKDCGDDCPVEQVSWIASLKYANALSRKSGFPECYVIAGNNVEFKASVKGLDCRGYRLPTEAEWERGARSGTTTAFWIGSDLTDEQANFIGNKTVAVRSYGANPWGLYEVHGNVSEWVWDIYVENLTEGEDPLGSDRGSKWLTCRGGYGNKARYCRSAARLRSDPDKTWGNVGLRLVRTAF